MLRPSGPILALAGLAGVLLTPAWAKEARVWVDPPANLGAPNASAALDLSWPDEALRRRAPQTQYASAAQPPAATGASPSERGEPRVAAAPKSTEFPAAEKASKTEPEATGALPSRAERPVRPREVASSSEMKRTSIKPTPRTGEQIAGRSERTEPNAARSIRRNVREASRTPSLDEASQPASSTVEERRSASSSRPSLVSDRFWTGDSRGGDRGSDFASSAGDAGSASASAGGSSGGSSAGGGSSSAGGGGASGGGSGGAGLGGGAGSSGGSSGGSTGGSGSAAGGGSGGSSSGAASEGGSSSSAASQ